MWLCQHEALHQQCKFSPGVDAAAQVLLQRNPGGEIFVANLAIVSDITWSLISSESGKMTSF
jgi:hypothetical protein